MKRAEDYPQTCRATSAEEFVILISCIVRDPRPRHPEKIVSVPADKTPSIPSSLDGKHADARHGDIWRCAMSSCAAKGRRTLTETTGTDLNDLYHRYRGQLHHFILLSTRCPAVAEELVHDVFELYIGYIRRKPDEVRSPGDYLFAIAGNLLAERANKKKRECEALTLVESAHAAASESDLGDGLLRQAAVAQVREAITQLPAVNCALLDLYRTGHSYEEIAKGCGFKPKQVGDRLAHAKSLLTNLLCETKQGRSND